MRIASLVAPRQFRVTEEAPPVVGRRDVLIQVETCGVCTGDIETWADEGATGHPLYLGHEVTGQIIGLGPEVSDLALGDYVAAINGSHGYAEICRTSADQVVKLPPGMAPAIALGEPIACAVNAARRTRVDFDETVVMVGSGFMGLLLMQCIQAMSPRRFVALDIREEAVARARQYGADVALSAIDPHVQTAILDLTDGRGADVVIEATGTQEGLDLATSLTSIRGRLVILGYHKTGRRQVDMQQWNWKGLDVINAHERDPQVYVAGMRTGLDLIARGAVHIAELITHRLPLAEIDAAFNLAFRKESGYVKATIAMR